MEKRLTRRSSLVALGGIDVVHTGQLFFPDSLTDRVYAKAPYNSRPNRDTRNATAEALAQRIRLRRRDRA
jgi:hypothetical protein